MFLRTFNLLWKTILFLNVLEINLTVADSEGFLNSVIAQLKEENFPENHRPLYEQIFRKISRSVDGYETHESSQEPSVNSLDNQYLFDSQNDVSEQQENQNQDLADLVADNELSWQGSNFQPYDIQGYSINVQQPNFGFRETTAAPQTNELYANEAQNTFNKLVSDPLHFNWASLNANAQQLLPNDNAVMSVDNELANNNEPLAPTYYNYSPSGNTVGPHDNLIDSVLNVMKTHQGEHLDVEPSQKIFVEPLFVAMAGFVGVAMIFMSAVLFLPKLLTPPTRVANLKGPQELAALTKLAVEAIDGKDCTERIACEVGRAMRSMQVGSKPIRMLEVILPANMASQLAQIRKAVANKQSCKLIQCKRLGGAEQPRPKTAEQPKPKTAEQPKPKTAEQPKPKTAEKPKPKVAEKPEPKKKIQIPEPKRISVAANEVTTSSQ